MTNKPTFISEIPSVLCQAIGLPDSEAGWIDLAVGSANLAGGISPGLDACAENHFAVVARVGEKTAYLAFRCVIWPDGYRQFDWDR